MPSYLVETYLARRRAGERAALERRACSAAEELTRERTGVRFEGSIHVPEDEICFFVFDAPSGREAALAAQRAGLEPIRVVEAVSSAEGGEMKSRTVQLKTLLVVVGILAVAATVALSAASAKDRKPLVVAPDAVLTWNTFAVNAVRASTPTKVQTDGMVYMSYVQAAVYDAVIKLEGRYVPYHDFAFTVARGASVQAAVAAAARTTLDHYLPDQQATVDAEYSAYLATLSGDVSAGVTVGEAAAQRHHRLPQR